MQGGAALSGADGRGDRVVGPAAALGWLRAACGATAAAGLLILFLVVPYNIAARALFDVTGGGVNLILPGAIEISTYALMLCALAAIPASLGTGLMSVDILTERMPAWARGGLSRFWLALLAVIGAVLAWRFGLEAQATLARGEVSQDLRIPMPLIYGVAAAECAALAVLASAGALGRTAPQ